MAIDIHTTELPISPERARAYIQKNTDEFGIFFDKDRCYELSAILQLQMLDITRQIRRITLEPSLMLDNKNQVIDTLVKMGVSKAEFIDREKKDKVFTVDIRKHITECPQYSDDVKQVVNMFSTYASAKRNKGNIENFANNNRLALSLSKQNHRMAIGRPTWTLLRTSRIAAENPGIQGIPRTMGDIICEPKGYTLVRCDSGQIEPRINVSAYLKDDLLKNLIIYYKDAYYGILHFCRMDEETDHKCRTDFNEFFEPIEITDAIADMRQNIKRLTNAGSYGSTNLNGINPELADAYNKRIVNHPSRKAQELAVREAVRRGEEVFYGYFGTPCVPESTEKYTKGESGWAEHVVRCGINNPIQTTASELMMFSISEAKRIIETEAKDTHIAFYKHDEACFYVSDEDMANGIGDKLSDITAYNVDGWVPIEADPLIGVKPGDYPSYIL